MRRMCHALWIALLPAAGAMGQDLPLVTGVEPQPVLAQAARLQEALAYLGT